MFHDFLNEYNIFLNFLINFLNQNNIPFFSNTIAMV